MGVGDVVVLAGGTGGAKLARGMLDVVGPEHLAAIANPGDDIEIYGAYVSPDPDLVSFWLADMIDARGWGLEGDTFNVMDALRALGREVWFNLGDRDLAWCLERRRMLDEGLTPTAALALLNEAIGVRARVLPACDEPLRLFVNGSPLQEFLIRKRGAGPVRDITFHGTPGLAEQVHEPTPEVRAALADARAVVLGPSNPVISIWPILTVLEMLDISAPVVCVSPIVGGQVLKGPTAAFLTANRLPVSAAGVAAYYERVAPGLLDGVVADEDVTGVPTLMTDTRMDDPPARAALARRVLAFAESLAGRAEG